MQERTNSGQNGEKDRIPAKSLEHALRRGIAVLAKYCRWDLAYDGGKKEAGQAGSSLLEGGRNKKLGPLRIWGGCAKPPPLLILAPNLPRSVKLGSPSNHVERRRGDERKEPLALSNGSIRRRETRSGDRGGGGAWDPGSVNGLTSVLMRVQHEGGGEGTRGDYAN